MLGYLLGWIPSSNSDDCDHPRKAPATTLPLTGRCEKKQNSMKKTIELVEEAYRMLAMGEVENPTKTSVFLDSFGKPGKGFVSQPAYIDPISRAGVKWNGINFENLSKHGYPSQNWVIILSDGETFTPLSIMDGNYITGMRTAAATAVGIKYLAKKDADKVLIVGAGQQSSFQLRAINEVIKPAKIYVNDIRAEASRRFANTMSNELGLDVESIDDLKNAVSKSDILVLITSADEAVIKFEWVKKGSLICALGIFQQCDFSTIKQSNKIVVDHKDQTMHMGELAKLASKGYLTKNDLYSEIGDIVIGKKKGREDNNEIILYVPIGIGSLDVSTANWVYESAKKMGLGINLELF